MHLTSLAMTAALALGEWDRVLEINAWHVKAAAEEPDVGCPNVRTGPFIGATVLALRGDTDGAREIAPPVITEPVRSTYYGRSILAAFAALLGETRVAAELADDLLADPQRGEIADGFDSFLEALEALGRRDDLLRELPVARQLTEAWAVLGPVADRVEARLALADGRRDEARRLLEAAKRGFEELEMPFETARTLELLAETAGAEERIALLGDAWATYERLGATPSVERVRERLAAAASPA